MKIGAINMIRILDESKRGQSMAKQLKAVADRWQAKAEPLQQKLTQIQNGMERATKEGSSEILFKMERDSQLLRMELRQLQEGLEFELDASREHLRNRMFQEAQTHLKKLAEELQLNVILTLPSREVAYVSESLDITDKLIERLDRSFNEGAPRPAQNGRPEAKS